VAFVELAAGDVATLALINSYSTGRSLDCGMSLRYILDNIKRFKDT